jgi:hypothetical protein
VAQSREFFVDFKQRTTEARMQRGYFLSLRTRVRALERKQANAPGSVRPPVEFFDAILAGRASRQEWDRWAPWLHQNILHPPNSFLADSETNALHSKKVNAQVIKG